MPVGVFSSGGLNIQPNIIRAPVDPLERAIKEAQLYNLQQDPRFRERQLTLEALGLQNTQANHEAMMRVQEGQLAETGRHNKAIEGVDVGQLGEATRHNIATEASATRGQDIQAADSVGQQRAQVTTAMLHTILNDFNDPNNKAVAAETLARLGYPQLKETLGTQGPSADEKLGAAAVELLRKKQSGETTPTPKFDLRKFFRDTRQPILQ